MMLVVIFIYELILEVIMNYTKEEVMEYVNEEDVAFVRLAFCDIIGKQKNISIMASELNRAFDKGIAFDPSSIEGFGNITNSDLVLHPDPSTLMLLPWRPERGKVVRMYCSITYADGTPFECDSRTILADAVKEAKEKGLEFSFGSEQEFYLFKLDEDGNPTKEPYDFASDMDIAPEDKGENIRREICLTLDQMGIKPESSHHEEGPGQNEIDFKYADALSTADNVMTFQTIVKSVSGRNGLHADFSAKPLTDYPGNGFHINVSIEECEFNDINGIFENVSAGILEKTKEMTAFLNSTDNSYERFGDAKAPSYITWSKENRSQLVRLTATARDNARVELRSPDPMANPYIAFALIIKAALYGIENGLKLPEAVDISDLDKDSTLSKKTDKLPKSLKEARGITLDSDFVKDSLNEAILTSLK